MILLSGKTSSTPWALLGRAPSDASCMSIILLYVQQAWVRLCFPYIMEAGTAFRLLVPCFPGEGPYTTPTGVEHTNKSSLKYNWCRDSRQAVLPSLGVSWSSSTSCLNNCILTLWLQRIMVTCEFCHTSGVGEVSPRISLDALSCSLLYTPAHQGEQGTTTQVPF